MPVISSQIDGGAVVLLCCVRRQGEAGIHVIMRPGVCGIDQWMSHSD